MRPARRCLQQVDQLQRPTAVRRDVGPFATDRKRHAIQHVTGHREQNRIVASGSQRACPRANGTWVGAMCGTEGSQVGRNAKGLSRAEDGFHREIS
jgi:hypothetical protein